MGEKCCACSREFANGDRVVTFYFERVMAGEKSGALGFYEDNQYADNTVDRCHFLYQCLEKCFSPMDNPFMYDFIAEQVRKEVYEDEKDREEFDIPVSIDEDPPYCLWCKKEDTVWLQQQRDLWIFHCIECHKLWDQNEDELVWDPQRGYRTAD
jgi:hypothetical protein